jgi:hypothetical protein
VTGKREEWDVNLGYFLTPNVALSIGYKNLDRKVDENIRVFDSENGNYYSYYDYPQSVGAPIIGLAASLPISKGFNFYGNFAYGILSGDGKYTDNKDFNNKFDLDGNYYFSEIGFNYSFPIKQFALAINLGYRFQRLDMEAKAKASNGEGFGSAGDQHDSTSGFIFGLSMAF